MTEKSTDDARRHIVVIDHDPAILALFEELLESDGYRVTLDTFAVQVQAMHERLIRWQPDLVILDVMLGPEVMGWQLVQAMKSDPVVQDIPVIICTTVAIQVVELRHQLDALGIDVILKPFDIDHLVSVVESKLREAPSA